MPIARNLLVAFLSVWLASFQAGIASESTDRCSGKIDLQEVATSFDQEVNFGAPLHPPQNHQLHAPNQSFAILEVPQNSSGSPLSQQFELNFVPIGFTDFESACAAYMEQGYLKTSFVRHNKQYIAFVKPMPGQSELAQKYSQSATQFCQFCDKVDPKLISDPNLLLKQYKPFSNEEKQLLSEALAIIELRAPTLVLRACHNRRVLFLRLQGLEHGTQVGNSTPLAAAMSNPGSITFTNCFFFSDFKTLVTNLAHELAHQVDVCYYWSLSPEWLSMAQPRIEALESLIDLRSGSRLVNPMDSEAESYGLPTTYCAASANETFAECSAHAVMGDAPNNELNAFIIKNILCENPPAAAQENRLQNSFFDRQQNCMKEAVTEIQSVLSREPDCFGARANELELFKAMNKYQPAMRDFHKLLQLESADKNIGKQFYSSFVRLTGAELLSYNCNNHKEALNQLDSIDKEPASRRISKSRLAEIRVWALCRLNRSADAVNFMTTYIQKHPFEGVGYSLRAYSYACDKQYKNALQDMQTSHTLIPDARTERIEPFIWNLIPSSIAGARAVQEPGRWFELHKPASDAKRYPKVPS